MVGVRRAWWPRTECGNLCGERWASVQVGEPGPWGSSPSRTRSVSLCRGRWAGESEQSAKQRCPRRREGGRGDWLLHWFLSWIVERTPIPQRLFTWGVNKGTGYGLPGVRRHWWTSGAWAAHWVGFPESFLSCSGRCSPDLWTIKTWVRNQCLRRAWAEMSSNVSYAQLGTYLVARYKPSASVSLNSVNKLTLGVSSLSWTLYISN